MTATDDTVHHVAGALLLELLQLPLPQFLVSRKYRFD